ncbi:MAG: chromosomal replication initiator protein DnaA [Flavobacteriales bacterium]|nr:chromosomal replication initiator protein DnaA [Flavobacteriales bacterium]
MNQKTTKYEHVWSRCLDFIKDNISEVHFNTWFAPIVPVGLNDNVLKIQVPSQFFYEWLEDNYVQLLRTAIQKELGKSAKLVYTILMKNASSEVNPTVNMPSTNKQKIKSQEVGLPVMNHAIKNPFVIPGIQKLKIDPQLNPNLSFDNFVEGSFNRLARSAGQQISKRPGSTSFNPLFIYSDVGLGKTHLANAIGLKVKELHPEKNVLYVSMEKFIQQYGQSARNNTRNDFIHFYQLIDVLIIDDVHFLSGKTSTQEVFFQIFNHLHRNGSQIVLTSDKSPIDIQDVEERVISRFKWGLSADIQAPEFESKKQILFNKLDRDGIEINEEIIDYIASNVKKNIRELEGALNSIIAQSTFNKKDLTLELAENTLAKFINKDKREVTIDFIESLICDYFKIESKQIQSKTRKRDIVQARQLAMYFAKKYTNASLASIGQKIGNRDHATVLHACKTVNNLKDTDKNFKIYLSDLQEKIEYHG